MVGRSGSIAGTPEDRRNPIIPLERWQGGPACSGLGDPSIPLEFHYKARRHRGNPYQPMPSLWKIRLSLSGHGPVKPSQLIKPA
ncbi:hypothetical protein RRG08_058528 [Elysia crispata]|uniref:Uncharacterized protein n=1 Tax=Elysia crispata TaxID=231223 RepID=A0AAE1AEL0_9GAST|nr:hypothetical protein RRG08_058528 [Elysia crispata]